ncbi:hypothetical protein J1605_019109 [Eschrichtius robustus]|uniref:Mitogen-activated protein kinase kinase kinase 21 n=1 Tax=Eschrichtius robustus TaxID=9764 RepID=A0AB34HMM9_ESCRO|nr:hypothetical protein J1605_019109 [Eschrichtius robustus]
MGPGAHCLTLFTPDAVGRCPGDLQRAGGRCSCARGTRQPQELRSREEELTRAALQQKSQEELLRRREQQLAAREIDVLERELNILIFQLSQERPNVKKRKGKFKRSRLKLKDGRRISLPSDFQHKITVQASPNLDKRRSLNSSSFSTPSSPTVIPRLRAIQHGQRENLVEPESWEERTPVSPATSIPQGTPPNSLSRSPQRKKTESALYGCTALLASVALGLDIRELAKAQAAEDPLPKEERKKREGIFQRVPKSRSSANSATRLPAAGEGASSPSPLPPSSAANLLSMPSLSTKCLLQTDGEDSFESSTHVPCDPKFQHVRAHLMLLLQKKEQHITDGPCLMEVLLSPQLVQLSSQPPEPLSCPLSGFGGRPHRRLDLIVTCQVRSRPKNRELSMWCLCLALPTSEARMRRTSRPSLYELEKEFLS